MAMPIGLSMQLHIDRAHPAQRRRSYWDTDLGMILATFGSVIPLVTRASIGTFSMARKAVRDTQTSMIKADLSEEMTTSPVAIHILRGP